MMNEKYLNTLATQIHTHNVDVGWWDGNICVLEKLQLVSTEVAEATEGARKGLMDDKLPHFKMEAVELADTLIRVLDVGGRLKLDYFEMALDHPLVGSEKSVGSNHLAINFELVNFSKAFLIGKSVDVLNSFYSSLVWTILKVARVRGHNNMAMIINEKLAFNKVRPDHKKENRQKDGGKKF